LATLGSADQVAAPPALAGDALYCGFYINELMMRLLHRGDPHPELFERYRDTLAGLATGHDPQPGLRIFEKHLLDATGYGLLLEFEYGGQQSLEAGAWYEYRPEQGAVRVSERATDKPTVISGAALQALYSENLDAGHLPALRGLMRRVLRHHLGDKPLASEALYRPTRRRQPDTTGNQDE
jgi:DNA repair protein RecO (recombination protein O)